MQWLSACDFSTVFHFSWLAFGNVQENLEDYLFDNFDALGLLVLIRIVTQARPLALFGTFQTPTLLMVDALCFAAQSDYAAPPRDLPGPLL